MSNDESAMVRGVLPDGSRVVLRYPFVSLRAAQPGPRTSRELSERPRRWGRLSERPMEADCKSVGVHLRRFESCTCHRTNVDVSARSFLVGLFLCFSLTRRSHVPMGLRRRPLVAAPEDERGASTWTDPLCPEWWRPRWRSPPC